MNCLLLQSNHAVLLQPETFILVLPLSCYTHKQKCRRGAPPKKNAKHLRLGVLGSPCIDPLLKYLGQNISCVMTCHEVSIGKVQQYLVFVYDVCIYIYIWHCCLLSCRFFQFHHKSKDWTLWGSRLGVEGRSIPVFLVAFLGEGCICMMIVSCHHASYLVALCMCFVPRCKLLLQEPPDLALHENVLQFPQEKMADLLRTPVLFCACN